MAGSGLVYAHYFRSETTDDPTWGRMIKKWRWGRPVELTLDRNRDGKVDVKIRYRGTSNAFITDEVPEEYWQDTEYRGFFDLHVVFSSGSVQRIELDRDGNGAPERILIGADAVTFHRSQSLAGPK